MAAENNPFEALRAIMIDNLEKTQRATQGYVDLFEKTMRNLPNANEEQIGTFKSYVERQVAANHAFVDKLLRAKDFQEALRIQVEYFQSQLRAAAEDATRIGTQMAKSFKSKA